MWRDERVQLSYMQSASYTASYHLTPFGQLCFEGRQALGMTRPELAKQVHTTPLDISQIESGTKRPPALYVLLVMQVLHLDKTEVELALAKQDPTYQLTRIGPPKYGAQQ